MDLAKTLRTAIEASGKTAYALAQETGVDQANLRKFAAGKSEGLSLASTSKLMAVLGLEIRKAKKHRE